jgi:PTS system nitrogen regulatory IIA component
MLLSEILKPDAVRSVGKTIAKKRVLQEAAQLAGTVYDIDENTALDALQERESLGPTGVGEGVAIPHARIPGIDKVVGTFFRLEKPMDYDSVDRQPVDLVFTLFAPIESGVDHLKALALVSRVLRDPATRGKLRANADETTLYAILTEVTTHQAA